MYNSYVAEVTVTLFYDINDCHDVSSLNIARVDKTMTRYVGDEAQIGRIVNI
jgi:hypothetical protein